MVVPVPAEVVERINGQFRPEDETACAWRDEHDGTGLRVSVDITADSDEQALVDGHVALVEAARQGLRWPCGKGDRDDREGSEHLVGLNPLALYAANPVEPLRGKP